MNRDFEALVLSSIEHVRDEYVFPDIGALAADSLLDELRDGRLEFGDTELVELCGAVTGVLQQSTGDLHLRLIHHPDAAPDQTRDADYRAFWADQAAETAGGIRSVRRHENNVAIVEIGPFLGLPVYAGTFQAAAMNLCQGAAGVVLDLRETVGGTPDSAALICSYFFDDEPVHLSTVQDRHGTQQFWTLTVVPGQRLGPDVPVAVVVSSQTFSGGEELAFNLQELGRATVVGEQTRGGAHPRIGIRVHPHVELAVPVASPRSPRSGLNWEGTGVTPDVCVAADAALDRALGLVLSRPDQ